MEAALAIIVSGFMESMKAVMVLNLIATMVALVAVTYSLVKGPIFDESYRSTPSKVGEASLIAALYLALLTGGVISIARLLERAS